jgi:hypothetical protein
VTDSTRPDEGADAAAERLRAIEEQPLDERAAAYARINEELQSTLEGGDAAH